MIFDLWHLHTAAEKIDFDKGLRTRDNDATKFDKSRKITWEILEGVQNNDSRSVNKFFEVISDYLTRKGYALLKQWGAAQHYPDVPDAVNGFILDKILMRRKEFWAFFFKNKRIQDAKMKGEPVVPFASAISKSFMNYMTDMFFRGKKNQVTHESIDDLFDLSDLGSNPFTHMNRTQQERQLHAELVKIFKTFVGKARGVIKAMEPLLYELLFEGSGHEKDQDVLRRYMRDDVNLREYVTSQGGDIDADAHAWFKKLHNSLRNAVSRFKSLVEKRLDPKFLQMATQAYVLRVAQESLDELKVIAEFGRIAKWFPPSTYKEYGYKPTYEEVKSQAYMQIDLAVSYAAVVYETMKYMRATGFNKQLIKEDEFYAYASKAGFPLENGRIPHNYLSYLIHKYRHLYHPSLDLDHPEHFTAIKHANAPVSMRLNPGGATSSLRLMAEVSRIGYNDDMVRKFVKENIDLLSGHELSKAYERAVALKFQEEHGFYLNHNRGMFNIRELDFEVSNRTPYPEIVKKFKEMQKTSPLSALEMKEKRTFGTSARDFRITKPGSLATSGFIPIKSVMYILEYVYTNKLPKDFATTNALIDKHELSTPGYRNTTIPEFDNLQISYFNNKNIQFKNMKRNKWEEFVRIYELARG